MSATPSKNEGRFPVPEPRLSQLTSQPERTVAHYREAIWTARIALVISLAAAGLAFVAAVLAAISLCGTLT